MTKPNLHLNFEIVLPKHLNFQSSKNGGMRHNRAQSEFVQPNSKNIIKLKKLEINENSHNLQPLSPIHLQGLTPKVNSFASIKAHQNKFGTFDLIIIEEHKGSQKESNASTQAYSNKKESITKSNNSTKNKLSALIPVTNCGICKHKVKFQKLSYKILYEAYEAKTTRIYNTNIINDIIFNANCCATAKFKDYLIYDERTEFLSKFNCTKDSEVQIKNSCEFYIKFSKVFPNYILLPEKKYMFKSIERKQKCINQRHNDLVKKSKDQGNDNKSLIFNKEFLKQVEKSLTRNKINLNEISESFSKTLCMKDLIDNFIQNDTLNYSLNRNENLVDNIESSILLLEAEITKNKIRERKELKNPLNLGEQKPLQNIHESKNSDTFKDKIEIKTMKDTQPKQEIAIKTESKDNKEIKNSNNSKLKISVNPGNMVLSNHQRAFSSSNSFLNILSPSNQGAKKLPFKIQTNIPLGKELELIRATTKVNDKMQRIPSSSKTKARASSSQKKSDHVSSPSTKGIQRVPSQIIASRKNHREATQALNSPTKRKGVVVENSRRNKIESSFRPCTLSDSLSTKNINRKS